MINISEEKEKVLEKIRKLVAMQTSSNPNEVENATRMIQQMIDKYSIDISELENINKKELVVAEEYSDYIPRHASSWIQWLASAIGQLYSCRTLIGKDKKRFTFIGFEVDRIASRIMFERISQLIVTESKKKGDTQALINDFSSGATLSIVDRIKQIIRERKENSKQVNDSQALIVVKEHSINLFIEDKYPNLRTHRSPNIIRQSQQFMEGLSYGEKIVLNEQIKGDRK